MSVTVAGRPRPGRRVKVAEGQARHFRPDIEGLRAIAIGSVLLYHAGVGFLHGGFVGVDVFFVISGYLITSHLVREIEGTGRLSLAGFYARRMRRLLPAAVLVLAATTVITRLTVSNVEWRAFGGDIGAAAGYVLNWRLSARSVDYLAEGTQASPVQHFWSLSVEEQFYVVWPLLLLLVALLVRRLRWRLVPTAAVALGLVAIPSFIWSVRFTAESQASAFFVTPTRLWELAAGGACAIGVSAWHRIPRGLAILLGWLGLAAIVGSIFAARESSMWSGWLAAFPVLGTAAIIIAGTAWQGAPPRFLSARPMVWVGALSYSLYLWHWPLLIGERSLTGNTSTWAGLLVVAISFVPAWLSYRYVEQPVRRAPFLARSSGRALGFGVSASIVGAVCGLVLMSAAPVLQAGAIDVAGGHVLEQVHGGITGVRTVASFDTVAPLPANAAADSPSAYHKRCVAARTVVTPMPCQYGDRAGSTSVYLVGDSKALQWITPMNRIAKKRGWNLKLAKLACPIAGVVIEHTGKFTQCRPYSLALRDALLREKPDVVIVSQGVADAAYDASGTLSRQAMVDAYANTWNALEAQGIQVVLIQDVPAGAAYVPGEDIDICVSKHLDSLGSCAFSREKGVASSVAPVLAEAASQVPGIRVVDMTDALCNDTECPAVIGGNLVYRQGAHLTNSYAASLRPFLDARLAPIVESRSR